MRAPTGSRDPVGWLVRVAWGRRLETGLTFATVVARVGLAVAFGPAIGQAVLMAISALAVVPNGPSREWMIGLYRRERLERHYGKVFAAVGIDGYGCTHGPRPVSDTDRGRPRPRALPPVHGQGPGDEDRAVGRRPRCGHCAGAGGPDGGRTGPARRGQPGSPGRQPHPLAVDRHRAGPTCGADCRSATTRTTGWWSWSSPGTMCCSAGSPGRASRTPCRSSWRRPPSTRTSSSGASTASWSNWPPGGSAPDGSSGRTSRTPPRRSANSEPSWRTATPSSWTGASGRSTGRPGWASSSWSSTSWPSTPRARARARDEFVEVLRDIVARGTGRRHRGGGRHPEAGLRHRADLDPGPVRVPAGHAVLDPGRLGHRARAGWATEGYSASDIDPANRGVGYLLAEGTTPRRMRCFVLEDRQVHALAKRAAELRGGGS